MFQNSGPTNVNLVGFESRTVTAALIEVREV